jgi:hypothetical protein
MTEEDKPNLGTDESRAGALATLEMIEAFCAKVDARAEEEMLKTGTLEGAHKRAMDRELLGVRAAVAILEGMHIDNPKDGEMRVTFTPQFIEGMQRIPEEHREELMAMARRIPAMLAANPYAAFPLTAPLWYRAWWSARGWLWSHGIKIRP